MGQPQVNGWFKKHWYKCLMLAILIIGFIYGVGAHETKQDSTIEKACEEVQEVKENQDEILEVLTEHRDFMQENAKQQAITNEFLKLFREDIMKKAEDNVNNNDST